MNAPTPRTPLARRLADLAQDGAGLGGAALIVAGVWQIYSPAALIVAGALVLAAAWRAARRSGGE